MAEDIYIDVNYLTESERDIILQVLAKDEELRKQEKRRIRCVNFKLISFGPMFGLPFHRKARIHILNVCLILPRNFLPCSCC